MLLVRYQPCARTRPRHPTCSSRSAPSPSRPLSRIQKHRTSSWPSFISTASDRSAFVKLTSRRLRRLIRCPVSIHWYPITTSSVLELSWHLCSCSQTLRARSIICICPGHLIYVQRRLCQPGNDLGPPNLSASTHEQPHLVWKAMSLTRSLVVA
jgi:hypothetical protein